MYPTLEIYKNLIFHIFVSVFSPRKTVNYIHRLFELGRIFKDARQMKNRMVTLPFYLIHLYLLINAGFFLFMSWANLNEIQSLMFCDILRLFGVHKKMNLGFTFQLMSINYYFHIMYLDLNRHNRETIEAILKEENEKIFCMRYRYKNVPAAVYIKKRVHLLLNLMNIFIYAAGLSKMQCRNANIYQFFIFS